MAVKGPTWFLAQCLMEERKRTPFTYLAGRALDLGLSGKDATRGHINQAVGAVQQFFAEHPSHRKVVASAPPTNPFKPSGTMLKDWKTFLKGKNGTYARERFGYSYDTLKTYLTPKYGGKPKTGGGGDNELHIVMRLMAEFL